MRLVASTAPPARRVLPAVLFAALLALASRHAGAAAPPPMSARQGTELATAAALSWASDAHLVYVENDEDVDAQGASARWGYLYYSPTLDKMRGYSVRGGRIVVAEDLPMKLEAPPLAPTWLDSDAALAAAESGARKEFREMKDASLASMLLMRGPFLDGDPDQTTWTLVYTVPGAPSLFVVVDATEGKVRRVWKG